MRILGIDTATRDASVALVQAGAAGDETIAEARFGESGASGAEILPAIDACLAEARLGPSDIDLVAVSIGPGSFTGLRVGLATGRGLALGGKASVVGVPTLEALAHAALVESGRAKPDLLCACLDARRGQVYAALYRVSSGLGSDLEAIGEEAAMDPNHLLERVRAALRLTQGVGELVFAGDGAERYRDVLLGGLASLTKSLPCAALPPRAAVVARLGGRKMRARGADDPAALVPRYVRASEAEVKRGLG